MESLSTKRRAIILFSHEVIDSKAIVTLGCDLGEDTSPRLRRYMKALIDEGFRNFVLDMKDVAYIASCGLGVLCDLLDNLEDEGGGSIRLVHVNDNLKNVLNFVQLDALFPVFPSVNRALYAS